MRHLVSRILLLAAVGGLGSACYEDASLHPLYTQGETRVFLKGMPYPAPGVASVEVYVVDISASTQAAPAASGTSWRQVAVPRRRFDLMQLQDDKLALAGTESVPNDIYYLLRITIDADSSRVALQNGAIANVNWPSEGYFTVLVKPDAPILVPDSGTSIVVEFDLERSLVGGLGSPLYDFLFTPVIRAVDVAVTGAIRGVISGDANGDGNTWPIEGASVSVFRTAQNASPDVWQRTSMARTDAAGRYEVAYLIPGFYSVEIAVPTIETFGRLVAHEVEIVSGADFVLSVTLPVKSVAGGASWR